MGKGNKPKPEAQYQTALTQAQTKSPQEEALANAALQTLNWAKLGDFRNPRAGGLFVNYADPALSRRNRALQANAGGQGIYGMGVADPNYLASVKEHRQAQDDVNDAAQYESDIKEGVSRAAGVAGQTAGMDISRKMSVLGTTSSVYQNQQNSPKWWDYLIGGAQVALSVPKVAAAV